MWEDASLWAHWIHSFHMHLSYLGRAASLFTLLLAFSQLLSHHHRDWISVWGAFIHIWRPEIAGGWVISCLLICQEIFSSHKAYSPWGVTKESDTIKHSTVLQKWLLVFGVFCLFVCLSFCILWSRICPSCICMQLFLFPYSFFVLCCSRRGLSKCKHGSTAAKGPRS